MLICNPFWGGAHQTPSPVGVAGIFAGGANLSFTGYANTDVYFYTTGAVTAGTNLTQPLDYLAGVGNYSVGVFATGPTTDLYTYSTSTVVRGTAVTANRDGMAAAGNATVGVFGGQVPSPSGGTPSVTDIYTYAFNTMSAGTNLAPASKATILLAAAGNSTIGVFTGGQYTPPTGGQSSLAVTNIYNYSANTVAPGSNLSTPTQNHAAAGTSSFGIFGGGSNFNFTFKTTSVYTYGTNALVPGTNLGTARTGLAATGNTSLGVFGGGATSDAVAITDVYTYSGSTVTGGTSLKTARFTLAAASGAPGNF